MRIAALLLGVFLIASGCEPGSDTADRPAPAGTPPASSPAVAPVTPGADPSATTPAPDNTAINQRDLNDNSKTPIDQDEDVADIKVTAEIRKQVVGHSDFSVDAQNIKIITSDGKVTLRGPVKTQAEKETIEQIAHEVAGKDNVDNQIEIAP